jgi:hypothetical protein
MSEQTTAASSPAEASDVFQGQSVSMDEFTRYRQSGELPTRFKPAEHVESAPADSPEQTVEEPESAPDSDPEETQEQPPKGSGAEKRIKQLLARVKELERSQQPAAKQDATPDPSTAPAQQAPQYTRPKPTAEDKAQDGSPKYGTYEDFVEELADWKAEQRWVGAQREAAARAQTAELETKVADAHARYGDAFDASRDAFTKATMGPNGEPLIPVGILNMVSDSDILTDLVHKIGSDPDDLTKFVRMARTNPRQAILHIAQIEGAIKAELAGEPTSVKTPAPPKTQAPKPPSPVSGGSSRAFSADEWMRKRNKQIGKG